MFNPYWDACFENYLLLLLGESFVYWLGQSKKNFRSYLPFIFTGNLYRYSQPRTPYPTLRVCRDRLSDFNSNNVINLYSRTKIGYLNFKMFVLNPYGYAPNRMTND